MKFDWNKESEIISAIKSGGRERDRAISFLYSHSGVFQSFTHYISQNKGNLQDAEDIFQDAVIVFDRSIRSNKYRGTSSLKAYFFSICKLSWMNRLRKNKKIHLVADHSKFDRNDTDSPESLFVNDERKQMLTAIVDQLGEKCAKIIKLWQLSYSMEEIAKKTGASSALIARKSKYRCMKSLLKLIDNRSDLIKRIR